MTTNDRLSRLVLPSRSDGRVRTVARKILDRGLREGVSSIDPSVPAWSPDVVDDLRHRYNEQPDLGSRSFMEKLEGQLADAPDATLLLAADLLMLHALPLTNFTQPKKRERVETVLSWMSEPRALPDDAVEAFGEGSWNGGQGAHQHLWKWIAELVIFVDAWWRLDKGIRDNALADHLAWREVIRSSTLLPAQQNALLYLAFPENFLPIVNGEHKKRIVSAFAHQVDSLTGDDDLDLYAITLALQEETGGPIAYYDNPYLEQWWPQKDRATRRAWLIRPRRPHSSDANLVEQWRGEGYVSVAGTHLGTVAPGSDRQDVAAAVEEGYRHVDYAQRLQLVGEYYAFLTRMSPGDVVATVIDDQLWIGRVTGEVEYVRNAEPGEAGGPDDDRLHRAAEWSDQSFAVESLPAPLSGSVDQQGAVVDLTGALDALLGLLEPEVDSPAPDAPPAVGVAVDVRLQAATPELARRLHIDQWWLQEVLDVLQDRKQLIFYGPPGTGKTYVARALARHVTGTDAVRLVQFHPSYTYEDFFEGYRPVPGDGGTVGFHLQPGPLRQVAAEAREDPERPYVLIVDEINRANLAKVFGELYYLLEYRRDSVRLQYSPEQAFTLPPNVYVVGTMNTADRSIALVDAAIRRRFAFVELHPDHAPVRDLLDRWLAANHKDADRALLLDTLNALIGEEDRDFKIGPSYLMTPDADREGGLERIWQYSILPLLEEHYYGRMSRDQVHARFGLDAVRATATSTPKASVVEPQTDIDVAKPVDRGPADAD